MKKNDSLAAIGEALLAANSVLILPHVLMDGDAMGSAAALCAALREKGRDCHILVEDKLPDYLTFLDEDYTLDVEDWKRQGRIPPDVSLCIDCGEEHRFPLRAEAFRAGRTKICLDHHRSSPGIGDLNYIDPGAAATGEIVYDLLRAAGLAVDERIANALFAAITTDTGNFQYSNTTARSHEIVVELYGCGLRSHEVSVALYENESLAKMKLHSALIESAEKFANGEGAVTTLTQEMLAATATRMEDSEGVVGALRSIRGVQVAVFLKEQEDGSVKVSLRSKERGDVATLSEKFGGGGHLRAAGCTIKGQTLDEVRTLMIDEVTKALATER